jgi:uncharacterized protein YdiU (UPF0061 family)
LIKINHLPKEFLMTEVFSQPYLSLPASFYQRIAPEAMQGGRLLSLNEALRDALNLPLSDEAIEALTTGQAGLPNCEPLAQKYNGHQFGYYNPQLGDGRGVLLGQWTDKRGQHWDFHLKGAGRTAYSRQGDGRAVLRSVIREYLGSEALAGLGIPTTRALSLAVSQEAVYREQVEPRSTLLRVAKTHIRFGHFEWAGQQGKETFETLLKFVVAQYFPQWQNLSVAEQAEAVLKQACEATAEMVAGWQSVGFNHGVMNTDNMSILGETFDFGPFAFLDDCQLGFICNHSDTEGRYAFHQQPKVALWNCQVLAGAFATILEEPVLDDALNAYVQCYNNNYQQKMRMKLGLTPSSEPKEGYDKQLVGELLQRLDQSRVDYPLFWPALAKWLSGDAKPLEALFSQPKLIADWLKRYQQRAELEGVSQPEIAHRVKSSNPTVVLRNYIAQEIIEAAQENDLAPLERWLKALQSPFEAHPDLAAYQKAPTLAQKGIQLSCSS